jgi:hypothetical protein
MNLIRRAARRLRSVCKKAFPELPPVNVSGNKTVHFSIDDAHYFFKDLTDKETEYKSCLENKFLSSLKYLHDKYNAVFTLYVYVIASGIGESGEDFDIMNMTRKFDDELKNFSPWLNLSFHGVSRDTSPVLASEEFAERYDKFIERFAPQAGRQAIRLHRWWCTDEIVLFLKKRGVNMLLCPDDDSKAYNLDAQQSGYVSLFGKFVENGMTYVKTDLRLEKAGDPVKRLNFLRDKENIVLFTHEYLWDSRKAEAAIKWLKAHGYRFVY